MKKIVIFLMILFMLIDINIMTLAVENEKQDNVYLNVANTEIKNGEEFSFTINLANINVAAFDINIYFNNELLEYVSGP